MQTPTTSQPSAFQKVYYLRQRKTRLFYAGFLGLAALLLGFLVALRIGRNTEDQCLRIFICFGIFGWALVSYSWARHTRLVVSPDGIEYYTPYQSIRTAWDDIESVGRVPMFSFYGEGLFLRRPALRGKKWLNWDVRLMQLDRFVPLSPFLKQWRDSELGQDVRRYAPSLFAQTQNDC